MSGKTLVAWSSSFGQNVSALNWVRWFVRSCSSNVMKVEFSAFRFFWICMQNPNESNSLKFGCRWRKVAGIDFRNLVDPVSSHMLVSRIKPCMSKFKRFILWDCGRLIISVIVYLMVTTTRITVVILELILALKALLCLHLLDFPPICSAVRWIIVTERIKTSVLTLHSSFCPISFRR